MSSGRADLISIMYFALFIQEQLKKEVDTMMSGGLERWWVGAGNTNTHTHARTHQLLHGQYLQSLQVQESSKAVVSNLLNFVVMEMPGEGKNRFSYPDGKKYIKLDIQRVFNQNLGCKELQIFSDCRGIIWKWGFCVCVCKRLHCPNIFKVFPSCLS